MSQRAFIESIVDDPTALERWVVYADWWIDHDDPRGELINHAIAIEQGLEDDEAKRLVDRMSRDEEHLLSPRLFAQWHHWDFTYWRGFIRTASTPWQRLARR